MPWNFTVNRIFFYSIGKSVVLFGKKKVTGLSSRACCVQCSCKCRLAGLLLVGRPQRVALFSIRLNILVLGGSSGFIELYAYGMFKIARVTGVSSSKFSVSLRK